MSDRRADTAALGRSSTMRRLALMAMCLWALAVTLPFIWTVLTSLRSTREIFRSPFGWPDALWPGGAETGLLENYRKAWLEANFPTYFANSITVVAVSLVLILAVSVPAAYAFARLRLAGKRFLLLYILTGLMVPAQLILVPLFFQYAEWSQALTAALHGPLRWLGYAEPVVSLHNSLAGLILIYVALSLPFSIFVMTGFFRTLPTALYEAAILDGCSEWQAFRRVMLPIARTGVITVTIFNFIGLWNEYLFALVFINDESLKTLPLGLASITIQANYKTDFGLLFAGLVIVMIPTLVVYVALQERITRGITVGALKA